MLRSIISPARIKPTRTHPTRYLINNPKILLASVPCSPPETAILPRYFSANTRTPIAAAAAAFVSSLTGSEQTPLSIQYDIGFSFSVCFASRAVQRRRDPRRDLCVCRVNMRCGSGRGGGGRSKEEERARWKGEE